jgi:hypothetical protein
VCCGTAADVDTDAMIKAAPGATWEFWEDPKYEWLGDWHGYTPSAGELGGDCDSDGNVVIDARAALATLAATWGPGWKSVSGWVAINALFPERVPRDPRLRRRSREQPHPDPSGLRRERLGAGRTGAPHPPSPLHAREPEAPPMTAAQLHRHAETGAAADFIADTDQAAAPALRNTAQAARALAAGQFG